MHSANRAFEASVHVRGRPVKEVHHRGRTYIEGRKGTEYTLHFTNNRLTRGMRANRVLVIPSVDGLCVLDGKPAGRNSPGFVVEYGESIDIPGWMVDSSTAAKFTFWPQDARGESTYVEELSKSGAPVDVGNQGLIGFMVLKEHFTPTLRLDGHHSVRDHATWQAAGFETSLMGGPRGISDPGPMYQSMGITASSAHSSLDWSDQDTGMGTKFGDATDFRTRTSEFNRGAVAGEIVIEYDTIRGLKDRGVPVHLFKGSDKRYGERTAFPADVGCTPPKGWRG